MENNNLVENDSNSSLSGSTYEDEEYTPKLFTEEQASQIDEINTVSNDHENKDSEQLFDQDINEDEDFEIPAFLRKQKF